MFSWHIRVKRNSAIRKGLETKKTIGVEISGTSQIVGKDSNLHIAELSEPAGILALEYNDSEVSQNCNTQEVRELFPTCNIVI